MDDRLACTTNQDDDNGHGCSSTPQGLDALAKGHPLHLDAHFGSIAPSGRR